ncbi:hypothetical protein F8M41_025518 [Gigaspora margarita]|uniref:G-protein coupled receptors family 2 profile 2 domain-containing protein n=1 Tax=Gigaspora margarita TaxID=4874 RepID=A0A8H3XL66_GIGMA|nr:hypothetical protein F8M41_025518 [Gigaspora margarita]
MYGYDDVEVSCWYRNSGQVENIIWQWVTLFSWIVVSILYCAFVVMLVIKKLKSVTKKADLLDSSQVSDYPALINRNLISSVVRRVMWYPLVPLVVQFFNLFVETYAYVHSEVSYTLLLLCDIGLSLSVDSYAGNKIITLTGKDDSKQDITYDSRNNDQNIHLIPPEPIHLKDSSPVDLFSNSLSLTDPVIESSRSNQTNQINQANQINISNPNNINNPNNTHVSLTNVIDESNCPVDDDGQINIILVNGETEDLSQNNEKIIQMLKML